MAGPKEQERDPGDADKEDLAELERGLAEHDAPEEPDDDEEEEDDEPDPEEYLQEPEERQPRRARRSARFDDLQRERDAEREQRIRLEAQLAAMQRPAQPQQSVQDFEAQVMDEAKRLQNDRLGLQRYAQARGDQLTQAEVDDLMNRELQIQFRQQELAVMLANQRQRASAPPQVDPGMAYLHSMYSDVVKSELGVVLAQRHYLLARQKGRPDGLDLAEEAYKAARAEMRGEKPTRQGERPRPTVESRARYTGTSATGTGSGSARAPQTVTLTKEEAELAKAAFSYEKDPKKRLQRYVTEVKRPAEAAAAARRRA